MYLEEYFGKRLEKKMGKVFVLIGDLTISGFHGPIKNQVSKLIIWSS